MFLLSVAAAEKTVRIEDAYFVPDAPTCRALIDARHRGVSVEVIVPGPHIDEKVVRWASRAEYGPLLKAGILLYEYQPTMMHCKQLIVDDMWVSLGSSNIDDRSFRLNEEANLNVLDASFAAEQTHIFERDKGRATPITLKQWQQRPAGEKLLDGLSRLLRSEI